GRRAARGDLALLGALRVPELRDLDAGARAPRLLLQLAPRLLPRVPRTRLQAGHRPEPGRARSDALAGRGRASALEPRGDGLLAPPDRGRRREPRHRRQQAVVAAHAGGARRVPLRDRAGAPPRELHEPLRAPALLLGPLPRRREPPRAPLRGDRLGSEPRADRELHGGAALPGLDRKS